MPAAVPSNRAAARRHRTIPVTRPKVPPRSRRRSRSSVNPAPSSPSMTAALTATPTRWRMSRLRRPPHGPRTRTPSRFRSSGCLSPGRSPRASGSRLRCFAPPPSTSRSRHSGSSSGHCAPCLRLRLRQARSSARRRKPRSPMPRPVRPAVGGGGGGGIMSEGAVFHAPLVTVPRAATIAGKSPRATPGAPAAAAIPPGVTQPGVAGVRTPEIHGSVPPTPGVSAPPGAAPMGGSTAAGTYPRGVMNPTVAEIAAVALPGVAGLLFLTFSGGMIGYRQANSIRYVRTAGADRFLP